MKSNKKGLTKAQILRGESNNIGDVKVINGVEMQLKGHSNSGNQIWVKLKK